MVHEWLNENMSHARGVILDGFPRTCHQANLLDTVLQDTMVPCYLRVAELRLPDATVVQRLTSRRICSNGQCQAPYTYAKSDLAPQVNGICDLCGSELIQRSDDTQEVIQQRLQTHHACIDPLLQKYRNRPEYLGDINADQSLENVYNAFIALT